MDFLKADLIKEERSLNDPRGHFPQSPYAQPISSDQNAQISQPSALWTYAFDFEGQFTSLRGSGGLC